MALQLHRSSISTEQLKAGTYMLAQAQLALPQAVRFGASSAKRNLSEQTPALSLFSTHLASPARFKKTNSIHVYRVRYTGIITFAETGIEESFKGAFFGCLLSQWPRADQICEVRIFLLLSDGWTTWSVFHSKGSAGACTMKDRRRP